MLPQKVEIATLLGSSGLTARGVRSSAAMATRICGWGSCWADGWNTTAMRALGSDYTVGGASAEERQRAGTLVAARYADTEWTRGRFGVEIDSTVRL